MSKVLASSDFYQNIRAVVEQSRRKTAAAVNFLMIKDPTGTLEKQSWRRNSKVVTAQPTATN